MQLSTLFSSGPPLTNVCTARVLASFEYVCETHIFVTGQLPNNKAKRMCLPEAPLVTPPAHCWNNGRLRWGWRTTPIKVKTITAATHLTMIANASVSTIWHPKRVMKTTESKETGGRLAGNVETCTYNSLCHSRHRRR